MCVSECCKCVEIFVCCLFCHSFSHMLRVSQLFK